MYKRGREKARERRRGGTLLEINRNVTIFQQPLPVPRASFSRHFPSSCTARPDAPFVSSLSIPAAENTQGKNRDTRERRGWLRVQGAGKKRRARFQQGEEEVVVAAVMYLQGNETSGGSDGKEQRATWENRRRVVTSPRGKPDKRRDRLAYRVSWD